jgi:4-hydroxy-4-methyl-2-oxoglutarate aldolase
MRNFCRPIICFGIILWFGAEAYAQLGMFSKEQRLEFTREWKGERFPDGRPNVPDELLKRLKTVDAEEAWGVLRGAGFDHQFAGGFKTLNTGGERLVGRVVTAVFMPLRPDVNGVIKDYGKKEGRTGTGQNSWVIDTLQPGDVLVVDLFGKIQDGTFAGDNLGTSIYAKSHTGLIVDGSVRDATGLAQIKGFQVFVRDFDPSALREVTLMGINVPIRIGGVTVMPGDIVVSDPEGVTFIPPQLCEKVADSAELTHLVDEWGHLMLREGKYSPGQIDGRWSKDMIEEFNQYVARKGSKLRMKEQ